MENWHPTARELLCRRRRGTTLLPLLVCAPGLPARSQAYVTVRFLDVSVVTVVKAQPRGAAHALIDARSCSRESNCPSGGRQSAGNCLGSQAGFGAPLAGLG
ncbi:hypothetical protein VFPFJ_01642 [Purpureocillium lilacinum]|uniref:Uncharacterized protein n=1 Tax=Purpureocillium lilacinum TaxID=33203 RepID=A0A179I052_PURLI|nr:hypothetical protein VFPFJ_01642 [Purpureocillium lilacinum]OAQ95532.1 hypothetical protein VFPFJ_01642 [Purpureocillium lilacinum]